MRCCPAWLFSEQVVQVVPKELEGRMQLFSRGALDKVRSLLPNQLEPHRPFMSRANVLDVVGPARVTTAANLYADGNSNRQSQPSVTAYVPAKPPAPDTLKHT